MRYYSTTTSTLIMATASILIGKVGKEHEWIRSCCPGMFGKTNDIMMKQSSPLTILNLRTRKNIYVIISDRRKRYQYANIRSFTSTQAKIKTQSKDSRTKASFYFASSTIREGQKVVTLANAFTAIIRLPGFAIFFIVSFPKISGQIRTSIS